MHRAGFPVGDKAALRPIPYRAAEEHVNDQLPFLLVTGRTLYQFNAGTMTMRTANVQLRPADVLGISAHDAAQLKLENRRACANLQSLRRNDLAC